MMGWKVNKLFVRISKAETRVLGPKHGPYDLGVLRLLADHELHNGSARGSGLSLKEIARCLNVDAAVLKYRLPVIEAYRYWLVVRGEDSRDPIVCLKKKPRRDGPALEEKVCGFVRDYMNLYKQMTTKLEEGKK